MLNIRRELVHDLPTDGVVDRGGIGFETLSDEAEGRDDCKTKNPHGKHDFDERKGLLAFAWAGMSRFFGLRAENGHGVAFDWDEE